MNVNFTKTWKLKVWNMIQAQNRKAELLCCSILLSVVLDYCFQILFSAQNFERLVEKLRKISEKKLQEWIFLERKSFMQKENFEAKLLKLRYRDDLSTVYRYVYGDEISSSK